VRTPADLLTAAEQAGLSVESIEWVPAAGGRMTLAARFSFTDPWAAARLLATLAEQDAADPFVRAWALDILRACTGRKGLTLSGPNMPPDLRDYYARCVHGNVQAQIKFLPEPRETFQSARETIEAGAGDCDDHARLVHALMRAGGLHSRLHFFAKDKQPVHVTDKVRLSNGAYSWAETTIPAEFGEEPFAAYRRLRRLGLVQREEFE
jgi:transglutaminase superfamily protein